MPDSPASSRSGAGMDKNAVAETIQDRAEMLDADAGGGSESL
jgi:hypothetical protein